MITTPAIERCSKEIGPAHNAELQSLNYHSNRAETGHFFAVIATGKKCKVVQDDFNN